MKTFSAGHRCPACRNHRVERRALHGWIERTVLPRVSRHAYLCLECQRRFWDRPHRRQDYAPPPEVAEPDEERRHRRRRPRWRVEGTPETTPYSRARVYAMIGIGWLVLLGLFFALRAFWPAAGSIVRGID
jgi:hypothetical protein